MAASKMSCNCGCCSSTSTARLPPVVGVCFEDVLQWWPLFFIVDCRLPSDGSHWPAVKGTAEYQKKKKIASLCQSRTISAVIALNYPRWRRQCRIKILEALAHSEKWGLSPSFEIPKKMIFTLKFFSKITKTGTKLQRLSKKYKNLQYLLLRIEKIDKIASKCRQISLLRLWV